MLISKEKKEASRLGPRIGNKGDMSEALADLQLKLAMGLCPFCCKNVFQQHGMQQAAQCQLVSHYDKLLDVCKWVQEQINPASDPGR